MRIHKRNVILKMDSHKFADKVRLVLVIASNTSAMAKTERRARIAEGRAAEARRHARVLAERCAIEAQSRAATGERLSSYVLIYQRVDP